MGLFHRKKKVPSLSESQGVPEGTFRCDVCGLVQPAAYLCGCVLHGHDGELPQGAYALCGPCALWLGFGESRFPQGLCFHFTEDQVTRIVSLRKETKSLAVEAWPDESLPALPNALELSKLRIRLVPEHIQSLVNKLSRGEFVDPAEIEKANRGSIDGTTCRYH
jgi:hypothetical protein